MKSYCFKENEQRPITDNRLISCQVRRTKLLSEEGLKLFSIRMPVHGDQTVFPVLINDFTQKIHACASL